jgi:hypothetical protein
MSALRNERANYGSSIIDDMDMISIYGTGQSDRESESCGMRMSSQVELQFMMTMAKVSLQELRLLAGKDVQKLVTKLHAISREVSDQIELRDPQGRHSETDQRSSVILKTLDEIQIQLCKLEEQTQLQPSSNSNTSVSRCRYPWCGW